MDKKLLKIIGLELRTIKLTKDREYHFHTGIFLGLVVLLLGFVVVILSMNGFDYSKNLYLACNSDSMCQNALYRNYPLCIEPNVCELEALPPHFVYGKPPPYYLTHMKDFVLYGLLLAFIINHLAFNKGFSFKKVIEETDPNKEEQ